jgi:hypothetical protein
MPAERNSPNIETVVIEGLRCRYAIRGMRLEELQMDDLGGMGMVWDRLWLWL